MESAQTKEAINKKKGWMAYIEFLGKWLLGGSLTTFMPYLLHQVDLYVGLFALYASLGLWITAPISASMFFFTDDSKLIIAAKIHYCAWGLITLWVWLAYSIHPLIYK